MPAQSDTKRTKTQPLYDEVPPRDPNKVPKREKGEQPNPTEVPPGEPWEPEEAPVIPSRRNPKPS